MSTEEKHEVVSQMTKGSISLRCAIVGMSRDTYYQFPKRKTARIEREQELVDELRTMAEKRRFKLGIRTLTMAYNRRHKRESRVINRKKVARLKKEHDIPTNIRRRPPRMPVSAIRMAKKYMYFDNRKAIQYLGLTFTPARQALADAVEWFRRHRYA